MSQKLKQTIEWFLKDTPNDAEFNLTNLRCNPSLVKTQLYLLGYETPAYARSLGKLPNEMYKYAYHFAPKFGDNFALSVICDVETFDIRLIKYPR